VKTKKQFGIFRNTDAELAHWWVKLSLKGRRHSFDLGTHIKADALKKARDIYLSLHANGWEVTLANFSDGAASSGPPTTIGEFCERVTKSFSADNRRRTVSDYCAVLRRVSAEIAGIPTPGKKFVRSDYDQKLARINKLSLSILTREQLETWRKRFVEGAGDDPLAQRSARTTANSYVRQLKALFGKDRLKLLGLKIESPVAEMKLFKKADMRFKSNLDPAKLLKAGLAELKPEELKALVLMLCAGLRKNETDKLLWSAIDFEAGCIHVETTKYLRVKSEKSVGSVALDREILGLFRGWRANAQQDEFVLKSDRPVRLGLPYSHYRCAATFGRLSAWLQTQGVPPGKPLHTLRKMFGSMLNDRFGLHVASLGLRHADIGITSQHYVTKRMDATVGLGSVIGEVGKVVEFDKQAGKITEKKLAENVS
jgi:integrase